MTQRIFDVENKKDMQDLWRILPDYWNNLKKIEATNETFPTYITDTGGILPLDLILIEWHNKTEITRPIQEATNEDIGKICAFWDCNTEEIKYGKLETIVNQGKISYYHLEDGISYYHCRRLTKQEIEELC